MRYELNNIYNEDCLQAMKQIPDKYFELAKKRLDDFDAQLNLFGLLNNAEE